MGIVNNFMNQFELVKSLLDLNILVVDYNKYFKLNPLCLEGEIAQELYINNLNLSDYKKDILRNIVKKFPEGEIFKFYKTDSDVEVGITISHQYKRITTVFRGSDSLKDWLFNLRFFKIQLKSGVKIHRGFYQKIFNDNLFDKLKNDLNYLSDKYTDYRIIISGYSLGGALSTLFGYLYSDFTTRKIEIITFASPRIGDFEFMMDFNNKKNIILYRIQNRYDIVSVIPYISYYHVGFLIVISDHSFEFFNKNSYDSWTFNCFNFVYPNDHELDRYYLNLNKLTND